MSLWHVLAINNIVIFAVAVVATFCWRYSLSRTRSLCLSLCLLLFFWPSLPFLSLTFCYTSLHCFDTITTCCSLLLSSHCNCSSCCCFSSVVGVVAVWRKNKQQQQNKIVKEQNRGRIFSLATRRVRLTITKSVYE